jgi:asparagine synthase (glutamine-hydrolysing)
LLDRDTVGEGLRRLEPLKMVEAEITPRPRSAFAKVAVLESSLYMRNQLLRDTDWASMAHSLEVRVPLVDSRLLSELAGGTTGCGFPKGKMMLSEVLKQHLPIRVRSRLKTGFQTPINQWMSSSDMRGSSSGDPAKERWSRSWARYIHADLSRIAVSYNGPL